MGNNEVNKSSKEGKESKEPKTPTTQEQTSATSGAVTADWSGFQAYSPMPPHGFMASSPQAPYMWGVQQFIPPYGTPPHPYVAMYPHGAMYGHPTMTLGSYPFSTYAMPSPNGVAEASVHTHGNMEVDGKSSDEKAKLPIKRSKGGLGRLNMINGKNNESGKSSGASANDASKSAESASEGSSDGSNASSQNDLPRNSSRHQDSVEPSQNGSGAQSSQNGGSTAPHSMINHTMIMPMPAAAGAGPTTNLNIGMDYWGTSPSSAVHGKVSSTLVQGGMIANGSRDSVQSQLWIQDEREMKRERRKQSNRESARRSRLRKQAECEELAKRADTLQDENASLRAEVARLRSEYEQLLAQNASLKEKLGDLHGQEDPRNCHGDQNTGMDVEHFRQKDHTGSD